MAATLIVAALIAGVYVTLIAMHVAAIRHGDPAGSTDRPALARWLAAAGERRRGRQERDTVQRRLSGELDRTTYRSTMAALAAQDAVEHPLTVPKSLL